MSGPSLRAAVAAPITLDLEPGRFRLSLWRNVSISVWTDQMNADAVERMQRSGHSLKRRFPEGRSQVMIVCDGAPAPERELSERMKGIYDPGVSGIVCVAVVLEGTGFWASGIRSTIINQRMAVGSAGAVRTNDTIEQVVQWLPDEHLRRTGVRLSARALSEALTFVREQGTVDGA